MATVAMAALCLFDQARAASSEQQFLEFPLATQTVAASNGAAFAWLVRQGGRTQIRYARAPKFEPQTLLSVEDGDGQPPTDVVLSPDGQLVAFTTGNAFGGEQPYKPHEFDRTGRAIGVGDIRCRWRHCSQDRTGLRSGLCAGWRTPAVSP
jgi:hypothetical protein